MVPGVPSIMAALKSGLAAAWRGTTQGGHSGLFWASGRTDEIDKGDKNIFLDVDFESTMDMPWRSSSITFSLVMDLNIWTLSAGTEDMLF